jgi:DNA-repair protein complementing XP-A cells
MTQQQQQQQQPSDELAGALESGACAECGEDGLFLDPTLLRHFRLRVCLSCKQDRTLRDGWYELVSKTRAKEEYALPDSFFHGLAFLPKPNPRHESFAPLKLYLRKALLDEATRLYGGKEELELEKERRRKKAYEKAAKRTEHLLKRKHLRTLGDSGSSSDGDDSNSAKAHSSRHKARKKKASTANAYVSIADRDHKHAFAAETYDEEVKSWTKECACGMKVHFEKL